MSFRYNTKPSFGSRLASGKFHRLSRAVKYPVEKIGFAVVVYTGDVFLCAPSLSEYALDVNVEGT